MVVVISMALQDPQEGIIIADRLLTLESKMKYEEKLDFVELFFHPFPHFSHFTFH